MTPEQLTRAEELNLLMNEYAKLYEKAKAEFERCCAEHKALWAAAEKVMEDDA